ncbi:NACHT domain- and WD repeat-containing protein 1 [Cichlidogyrus casuarinus]|uniref:NACHT domain- and WD repeat-containing protein 1 n=1 Tax=Cichlidogyrus casuarinus TaxID=1844966 RepID=A0ABD2Q1S7_9PLAT
MAIERNALMKQVYPKLKKFCRDQYGFEFHAVDMRWGVHDSTQLDHRGPRICYEEVNACKALSAGPHFVTLLGQRYGPYEIPFYISAEELETISMCARDQFSFSEEETSILTKWYWCDNNRIPPLYQIRPILDTTMPHTAVDVNNASKEWANDSKIISKLFSYVVPKVMFGSEQMKRFSCSVTEHEIIRGIFSQDSGIKRRCAAFIRDVVDEESIHESNQSSKFLDYQEENKSLDKARRELIEKLKNHTLPEALEPNNIRKYNIRWRALNSEGQERLRYLRKFCSEFESKIKSLISRSVSEKTTNGNDEVYLEVLQHSHACVQNVKHFQGRQVVLDKIKDYIQSLENNEPLVIYGQSGCGKTSVLAKAAALSRGWLPNSHPWIDRLAEIEKNETDNFSTLKTTKRRRSNPLIGLNGLIIPDKEIIGQSPANTAILCIRFLGTSPMSSNIRQTIKNACCQLAYTLESTSYYLPEFDPNHIKNLDDYQEIVNLFYVILNRCSASGRFVLIFFDSIDQLDSSDGAYFLSWLQTPLPPLVRLVVSTLPDIGGILEVFKARFSENNFVKIEPLQESTCVEILQELLHSRKRTLQPFQWKLVRKAFQKCKLPIFIYLVEHTVRSWMSWHVPEEYASATVTETENEDLVATEEEIQKAVFQFPRLKLATTVRSAILTLFKSLENDHGKIFVSHALSYITASRGGISEAELEDLLSLDDQVLRDVFQHNLPPQIRSPPFVWVRLRSAIGHYLVEREADNIRVIYWYHRQFIEAAHDYFLSDTQFRKQIHSNMADYFLGVWAGRKKPFQFPQYLVKKLVSYPMNKS